MSTDPARPWLDSYAPGVPHRIDVRMVALVADRRHRRRVPDHVALEFFKRETTYAEWARRSSARPRACDDSACGPETVSR